MYTTEDLFDRREVVGVRLKKLLAQEKRTKMQFCVEADISRPTLDRLMAGQITNRKHFVNHMTRALNALNMDVGAFVGMIPNPDMKITAFRNMLQARAEDVCSQTGLRIERIREIESGELATRAELRDIAYCLGVGVRHLEGNYLFMPAIEQKGEEKGDQAALALANQHWGYLGIKFHNHANHLWYPISVGTRRMLQESKGKAFWIVPCTNNKLLFVNMANVTGLMMCRAGRDVPTDRLGNPLDGIIQIPPVVYESLGDYFAGRKDPDLYDGVFSENFLNEMDRIVERMKWKKYAASEYNERLTLWDQEGHELRLTLDPDGSREFLIELKERYMGSQAYENVGFRTITGVKGPEVMFRLENTAMIELPLAKTEEAMCRMSKSQEKSGFAGNEMSANGL